MATSSAPSSRRVRAAESFQTAAECIGTLTPGMALFALTRGQFSMIDAVLATLDQTGPAAISLWTWTIAEYEVQCVERLLADKRITAAGLIIDIAARQKNAAIIDRWRSAFGPDSVRYVRNHAKIARVWNGDWSVLLRGSMNLNYNPRFEQFDVTEGGPDFDLIAEVEAELPVLAPDCSNGAAIDASRLREAWEPEQLALFGGLKTWHK